MRGSRPFRLVKRVLRVTIVAVAVVLVLVGIAMALLETGWAKNQLRALMVREANRFLTATLEIDRLEGSLFRGLQLGGVRLSREGERVIAIDEVEVSYSIRELIEGGTVIRRLKVVRPYVVADKQPDGRWNLGALVRRERREQQRSGPRRTIRLLSIEVVDGTVLLRDPLAFGAANVPSEFRELNASLAFHYEPVAWRLEFDRASWVGRAPDLTVKTLSGGIANGRGGWSFSDLLVETPRSRFTLTGRVRRDVQPTVLDLDVRADRFAFQEWGGILRGIRNIAIESSFDVTLDGPLSRLQTALALHSNGGAIKGTFVLNSSVPGWHGAGTVDVARLDLAPWLNRPDRPSDITGRVDFNLDLQLGRGFPRGSYRFGGSHAEYMGYEADDVRARGTITAAEALIAAATARAYGASVRIDDGSIGIASPYPFRFRGAAAGVDLRDVPAAVPVPRVESTLTFDYDVAGRFSSAFITGRAAFAESEFLGARIGPGTVGSIDTAERPFRYSGEGDLTGIDLHRFGRGLDVLWLQDPRYAGTVSGHFFVEGTGGEAATMTLRGGGRLSGADLFEGRLANADVSIDIADGSLTGSYDGELAGVNPSVAFADPRFDAVLSGRGRGRVHVPALLIRSPVFGDYNVEARLDLSESSIRGVRLSSGSTTARLDDGSLTLEHIRVDGPEISGEGKGVIELDGERSSRFDYNIERADLALAGQALGEGASGEIGTKGRLTGPYAALHLVGDGTLTSLNAAGVKALTTSGNYDVTFPLDAPSRVRARVDGRAAFVEVFGTAIQQATGTVDYFANRATFEMQVVQPDGPNGSLSGAVVVHPERRALDVESLTVAADGAASWRLLPGGGGSHPATLSWDDAGFAVTPVAFADTRTETQRIGLSGTWRQDGSGALRVTASRVYLDTFAGAVDGPARYGGVLDADVTIRGTRERPIAIGDFTITEGRIRRLAYERLSGRIGYTQDLFEVNIRLDQSPGVWLTAVGSVPMSMLDRSLPDRPMHVSLHSSVISLGLLEGVTDVVRDVTGDLRLDVTVVGTGRDPHFSGSIEMGNAGFLVNASGARYRNGRASIRLSTDRINVSALHVEDREGHALDVSGSLGTHELRVSDLEITAVARQFEVLRNELGTIDVDARLRLHGQFESPRIEGDVTIVGGQLRVDSILDRTLFQPYSTEAATSPAGAAAVQATEVDALVALNPWERLGMDISLHVPNTLRMTGEDVQVAPGTPLGLGSFNLRVLGDLYLYKDPGQPLYPSGSFDQVTGTYAFQGRRFDVDPTSSINFRSDLNPELFVTVTRVISQVETRVTIAGPLRDPELRLASNPPLEPTDILSLIVFNTQVNQLTLEQQRQLAVRAGTLAAGFLATPLLGAIERTLGVDILEIEAVDDGTRVTIGDELAPGLVARFSRQFGTQEYDEATIEYYLSRIFRIRATFSDAATVTRRSPFRRVERAGIDFLVFFSF
jgi:translocation and assembly module TamB